MLLLQSMIIAGVSIKVEQFMEDWNVFGTSSDNLW